MKKRILALALVLCVLCSCVPVFAADHSISFIPSVSGDESYIGHFKLDFGGLLLTACGDLDFEMKNKLLAGSQLSVTLEIGTQKYEVSGAVQAANQVWFTSAFPVGGAVATAMAESGLEGLVRDYSTDTENGVIVSKAGSTKITNKDGTEGDTLNDAYKANIFYYLCYAGGIEQTQTLTLNSQTFTITPKTITVDESIPEGSFFISSSAWTNGNMVGYGQISSSNAAQYSPKTDEVTADGPYAVYVAPETGWYDVWAYKRDRNDTATNRQVTLEIAGVRVNFLRTSGNCTAASSATPVLYWEKENNNTKIYLEKGQEFTVQVMANKNYYGMARGIVFTPASSNAAPAAMTNSLTQSWFDTNSLTAKTVTTPSVEGITVNGYATTAVAKSTLSVFFKTDISSLNDGSHIQGPTVLDAVYAANGTDKGGYELTLDVCDESTEGLVTAYGYNGKTLEGFTVTVNGTQCTDLDQAVVSSGDVITVTAVPDDGETTVTNENFEPFSITTGGATRWGNGSIGSTDAIYNIKNGATIKMVTTDKSADTLKDSWPLDPTVENQYKDCYLNGYIVFPDSDATTGDDSRIVWFIQDLKILCSAKNANSSSRFEMGFIQEAAQKTDLGDGLTYMDHGFITGGTMQNFVFDKSNLYITNTKSAAELAVTVEKNGPYSWALKTNKSVPVCIVRVTKDDNGAVVSTTTENGILDFMDVNGYTVSANANNQTIYIWEGSFIKDAGTTMKPLCAPLYFE